MENTISKLVTSLNKMHIIQKSIDWIDDIPEDFYKEHLEGELELVATDDEHTGDYISIAIKIYKYKDGFIGVDSIVKNLNADHMSIADNHYDLVFYEMKEVMKIAYRIKKDNE